MGESCAPAMCARRSPGHPIRRSWSIPEEVTAILRQVYVDEMVSFSMAIGRCRFDRQHAGGSRSCALCRTTANSFCHGGANRCPTVPAQPVTAVMPAISWETSYLSSIRTEFKHAAMACGRARTLSLTRDELFNVATGGVFQQRGLKSNTNECK